MKKTFILISLIPILLSGCNSKENTPNQKDSNANESKQSIVVKKYTVKFENCSLDDVVIEEGKELQKPTDPTKSNSLFVGWYYDSEFKNSVSFPVVVNSDLTLYANFYSYEKAFALARNNTIGEEVEGYDYDYTLNVDIGYLGAKMTGKTIGETKYNSKTDDVTFYDEHVNSGALFYDGSKYQIKKGIELHEVALDETDNVNSYKITTVDDDYKYDSSSFAKAIFEYSDDKLKSISPTSTVNEYQLDTGFNFSEGLSIVGKYINHPIVESILGTLPSTSVKTGMYVTFSNDKLSTYRYEMKIDVSNIQMNLVYNLTFKNIGQAPNITPKVFNNTYVTKDDVKNAKQGIENIIASYKSLEHSSYDFKVKTAVSYPNKNDINATIDGFTKRKVTSDEVYFLNDYEIDTDHENADLYKGSGLNDCHGGRVKLANGEVHDLKKKALGGYSDIKTTVSNNDDYYLLDILSLVTDPSFIQKIENSDNVTTTYSIGSDEKNISTILNYFNDNLRLNALDESTVDVKAFGTFEASSVKLDDFEFEIVTKNSVLSSINFTMNGTYNASFPESRDFTSSTQAGFSLKYNLETTDKGSSFEPSENVSKVK